MAIPFMKIGALLQAWFALPAEHAGAWLEAIGTLGKFAMPDVQLTALAIVGPKGVGMGKVSIAHGLHGCASAVLLMPAWMQRRSGTVK